MSERGIRIATIVGARPQFVNAAVVSRAIAKHNRQSRAAQIAETIIHTGQHFDDNMSEVFFREMEIPKPGHHLELGGGSHGQMTGRMLEAIERVLMDLRPDWVLVYGDTNSTLAGTLAAVKLHIPVAHVEAGLRSFNRRMPEEINRVLTDHAADLLFAPTDLAVRNLAAEGVDSNSVERCGDVMLDAMLFYRAKAEAAGTVMRTMNLTARRFILATIHRAENTDDPVRLAGVMNGLMGLAKEIEVVLPLHPRTRGSLERAGLFNEVSASLRLTEPLGYFDMLQLEAAAALIATDSGGVQKEAYFNGVPCLTLRDETEWVELVEAGANQVVGADAEAIVRQGRTAMANPVSRQNLYGDGHAGEAIVRTLVERTINSERAHT